MYRDAYPSDRAIDAARFPAGYDPDADAVLAEDAASAHPMHGAYDEDDHEAIWAHHFRQFAHASAPVEPPMRSMRPRAAARRRGRGPLLLLLGAATVPAVAVMSLAGRSTTEDPRPALQTIVRYAPQAALAPVPREASIQQQREAAGPARTTRQAWMLDPEPVMGDQAATLDEAAPLESGFPAFEPPTEVAEAVEALAPPPAKYERAPLLRAKPPEPRQQVAQTVPLPQPRPADLMPPKPATRLATADRTPSARMPAERGLSDPATTGSIPTQPQRLAERPDPARRDLASTQSVFRAALPGRSPAGRGGDSALAYAGTNEEAIEMSPRARLGLSPNPASGQTAIYDISAQRVYLPGGRVLEAHSGKGEYMDDPRYVHLRMRGATPPGTYVLTERERPYHGVRALRMTPVGGSAAIHGRDGILAHTYMLRQRGASHGCVVFADYRSFLNAYLTGEIRQIKVVAGAKGGALPAVASRVGGFFGGWGAD